MQTTKKKVYAVLFITAVIFVSWLFSKPSILVNGQNIVKMVMAEDAEVIKVGFYRLDGFVYYDDMGNAAGYYVDYLKSVAMNTGWNYEFIEVESAEDAESKLQNHEIDLLAPCQITAERMEKFDYSRYSFGTEYTVLVTKNDNQSFYYEDYDSMNGKDIGTLSTYAPAQEFPEYMEENGFNAKLKYYDTINELSEALDKGEVDMLLMDQMMTEGKYKIVARYAPYSFYFMTWKGNSRILDKLDAAMQNLKNTYPGLENELLTKHFPLYNIQFFTREEQEFIDSLSSIKIAYIADNIPISFQDGQTGELAGISRDIFDKIQEVSGLKFEYEVLPQGSITYDYLRENGFDLVTGVRYNRSNLYSRGILITNPYLSSKMVLIGRNDEDFDINKEYSVAIISGSQTLENEIVSNYPNFNVVSYDTIKECFDSVRSKKTDLLLVDRYIANYWLSKPVYEKLYTIPVEGLTDDLCFSAVVDIYGVHTCGGLDGVQLVSIINKTLSQIKQEDLDEIILNENMENRYEYSIDDFIYKYRYAFIIGVIAIIFAVVFLAHIRNIKVKASKILEQEAKRLSIQQKRYQMIMDNSGEMVYDLSITGEPGFVSGEIKKKFGWSIPEHVSDFSTESLMRIFHIHPDDCVCEYENISKSIEARVPGESLLRIEQKNGEYIWCKVYFFPLLNQDNELVSVIGKIEDVDKEIKEKDRLRHESQTDGMTGLMNKQTFENEAMRYLDVKSAYHSCVIFVDLDHFKNLNDTLGHRIGDVAIKDAARKLQVLFANIDLVARFGGDEFCVLVYDIPKNTLIDKLERIVEIMSVTYTDGAISSNVTASVGAAYCTKQKMDYKTLLDAADSAVYEAKNNGRNCYIIKEL
jgi:diguanylate cyclase (GGDEF)-like protein/PAS domain S-box-containing protein